MFISVLFEILIVTLFMYIKDEYLLVYCSKESILLPNSELVTVRQKVMTMICSCQPPEHLLYRILFKYRYVMVYILCVILCLFFIVHLSNFRKCRSQVVIHNTTIVQYSPSSRFQKNPNCSLIHSSIVSSSPSQYEFSYS